MFQKMTDAINEFLALEAAGGILLMGATALALVAANSPAVGLYNAFLDAPVEVRVGAIDVAKPALLWINDGLMAVFFFLIGMELKREFLEGELSSWRRVALPAVGALGGMIVPVAIFIVLNRGNVAALRGWAIPAATDIAFAVGILGMLGSRVPLSLIVAVLAGLGIILAARRNA